MSLAVVYSRAQTGVQAPLVSVEVHLANGLPALSIVGLPETAVRESKDRVRSALQHSGFDFPARRITVNLAPADLPKQGGRYDLAIALGILAASGQVPQEALNHYEFVAELALGGALRPVCGVLPAALATTQQQRQLVCASENGAEAGLAGTAQVLLAGHLLEVCEQLHNPDTLSHPANAPDPQTVDQPDLSDVRGQHQARRALEISAAGNHSLLLVGPPGTGKTLLASRLPGLLPPLGEKQALEAAAVTSISAGHFDIRHWRIRPFRAPHHTASAAALVGGGSNPRPGEISLAHHGVLFLDEFPEFKRHVLEVLREPMETGSIIVSRASGQAEFPARFQLVAAMNPCPCGYQGDPGGTCHCTPEQIQRYRARISGPLLDRIDIQVQVPRISWEQLDDDKGETTAQVRERVAGARRRQQSRGHLNACIPLKRMDCICRLSAADKQLLQKAARRFRLSPRAVHRILRVARTIADLDRQDDIQGNHLQEAIAYRGLDNS
ncbi:MAG: YifB family Mg chelatase-like AAA ATPase [Thiogranum sp.]